MKTLAIVLAVCVIGAYAGTLTDEQKTKLKENKEACIAETGAPKDVIDDVIKGGEVKRDGTIDCFAACLLKKIGVMRQDGTIDVEASRAKAATTNVDMTKANEVIDKCKDLVGKDVCETGGNVLGCFIKNKTFPVLN